MAPEFVFYPAAASGCRPCRPGGSTASRLSLGNFVHIVGRFVYSVKGVQGV